MPELEHPQWCVAAYCNADRPPFNGHMIGAHRSAPEMVAVTALCLAWAPTAAVPSVEIRRRDVTLVLPLVEAQSLSAGIDDLLRQAGVGL